MNITKVKLVILLLTPIVLWVFPSTLLDGDKFPFCPSRVIFGFECLGCGMTRAAMHFHHLEFEDAIFYNKGIVLVYPILVWIWYKWVRQSVMEIGFLKK